jgi:hypothetical protein
VIVTGLLLVAVFTGDPAIAKSVVPTAKRMAVTVNGVSISEIAVHREMNRQAPSGAFHKFSRKTLQRIRKQAITNLVDRELLYREGLRRGITWDEKWVKRTFSKTRRRYAARPKIYKALGEKKTRMRLMEELRQGQVITHLVNSGMRSLTTTEQALNKYYRANKSRYRSPKIMRVQETFFPVKPWASRAEWGQAKRKATAARAKVIAGKSMSSLGCKQRARTTKKNSASGKNNSASPVTCHVQQRTLHQGAVSNHFNPVFSLKKGSVSKPLFTLKGYTVIRVQSITPSRLFAYKEVRSQVRKDLLRHKHTRWLLDLKSKLRNKANIVIAKGTG